MNDTAQIKKLDLMCNSCNSRSDENFISKKKILKLMQFLLKLKISK